MPEAAVRSNLGRCPACQQLVTVPAEGSSGELACPACQHRAPASSFATVELPRAAIVVPAQDGARPGARALAADPDRTHLLLDLAPDADDDADEPDAETPPRAHVAAKPPSRPARSAAPPRNPAQRSAAADNERTHLLLDAADLREEQVGDERTHLLLDAADLREEQDPPSPGRPRARRAPSSQREPAPNVSSDDERTHLQLGPLSLHPEQPTPLARALAWASRIVPPALRLSVWLDEALQIPRGERILPLASLGHGRGYVRHHPLRARRRLRRDAVRLQRQTIAVFMSVQENGGEDIRFALLDPQANRHSPAFAGAETKAGTHGHAKPAAGRINWPAVLRSCRPTPDRSRADGSTIRVRLRRPR